MRNPPHYSVAPEGRVASKTGRLSGPATAANQPAQGWQGALASPPRLADVCVNFGIHAGGRASPRPGREDSTLQTANTSASRQTSPAVAAAGDESRCSIPGTGGDTFPHGTTMLSATSRIDDMINNDLIFRLAIKGGNYTSQKTPSNTICSQDADTCRNRGRVCKPMQHAQTHTDTPQQPKLQTEQQADRHQTRQTGSSATAPHRLTFSNEVTASTSCSAPPWPPEPAVLPSSGMLPALPSSTPCDLPGAGATLPGSATADNHRHDSQLSLRSLGVAGDAIITKPYSHDGLYVQEAAALQKQFDRVCVAVSEGEFLHLLFHIKQKYRQLLYDDYVTLQALPAVKPPGNLWRNSNQQKQQTDLVYSALRLTPADRPAWVATLVREVFLNHQTDLQMLTTAELDQLARDIRFKCVHRGLTIFRAAAEAKEFFFLLSGVVDWSTGQPGQTRRIKSEMAAGLSPRAANLLAPLAGDAPSPITTLGLEDCLHGSCYSGTATAVQDCQVLGVSMKHILRLRNALAAQSRERRVKLLRLTLGTEAAVAASAKITDQLLQRLAAHASEATYNAGSWLQQGKGSDDRSRNLEVIIQGCVMLQWQPSHAILRHLEKQCATANNPTVSAAAPARGLPRGPPLPLLWPTVVPSTDGLATFDRLNNLKDKSPQKRNDFSSDRSATHGGANSGESGGLGRMGSPDNVCKTLESVGHCDCDVQRHATQSEPELMRSRAASDELHSLLRNPLDIAVVSRGFWIGCSQLRQRRSPKIEKEETAGCHPLRYLAVCSTEVRS
eukprot:GHVT01037476.1.p1 GENE.GHVT01037476.1~~GHVT01037476.1.p1  ORF type:complete len:783 (-),score=110.73 GHVT01037476.1:3991-6339(-)